jgi:hypothetical protein
MRPEALARIKNKRRIEWRVYMQSVSSDHLLAWAAALLLGAFAASIAATFRARMRDYVAKPMTARPR